MSDFDGTRILITGAASGFGLACAKALIERGGKVAMADWNESQLQQSVASLRSPNAIAIQMDVSSAASVKQGFAQCQTKFGGLDGLVNCAGIIKVTALADISEAEWDRVLSVNLKGPFLCCQAAAGMLCQSSRGRIVNVASDAAKIGFPLIASYVASKTGLAGLGRAVAAELSPFRVTVNTICPVGAPDTGMGQQMLKWKMENSGLSEKDVRAGAAQGNALGRNCESADVVNAVLFFLSKESGFLTGQSLDVDGGLLNVHGLPGVADKGNGKA